MSTQEYKISPKRSTHIRSRPDMASSKEPLNNSAQAWMGRVVPFFGDVQASL